MRVKFYFIPPLGVSPSLGLTNKTWSVLKIMGARQLSEATLQSARLKSQPTQLTHANSQSEGRVRFTSSVDGAGRTSGSVARTNNFTVFSISHSAALCKANLSTLGLVSAKEMAQLLSLA